MAHYRHLLHEVFGGADIETSASYAAANARYLEQSDLQAAGFALQDGPVHAYNEEAFQYFLEMERKRSELSNRPFLLMLVDFHKHPRIDAVTAETLFSVLSRCLRETDFIGWYREGRVAGAVLTQHGETEADDLSKGVRQRIGGALREGLPSTLAPHLQARVYQIPALVTAATQ
jgi:GGDEF domain-containing protein